MRALRMVSVANDDSLAELARKVDKLYQLRALRTQYDKMEKQTRSELIRGMRNMDMDTVQGLDMTASLVPRKSMRIDVEKLRQEHPDIAKACEYEKEHDEVRIEPNSKLKRGAP